MTLLDDDFPNRALGHRFPWSLYHRELTRRIAAILHEHGGAPRVLIVGCGMEGEIRGQPSKAEVVGCDLDARAVEACRRAYPNGEARFAVCPDAYSLPVGGPFDTPFDVVLAKEVVEHVLEPERWAARLSERLRQGGSLILTTPNYGRFSTLPILERTVLEWIARRQGFTRAHLHPTRFDRARLERLDVGPGMQLVSVQRALTGWSLLGHWRRRAS